MKPHSPKDSVLSLQTGENVHPFSFVSLILLNGSKSPSPKHTSRKTCCFRLPSIYPVVQFQVNGMFKRNRPVRRLSVVLHGVCTFVPSIPLLFRIYYYRVVRVNVTFRYSMKSSYIFSLLPHIPPFPYPLIHPFRLIPFTINSILDSLTRLRLGYFVEISGSYTCKRKD